MNYQRQDTVYVKLQNRIYTLATDTWALADADSEYPKISIIDSGGTTQVDANSMTNKATGLYEYSYQLASDAALGKWTGFILTSNSEYTNIEYFAFEVE